MEYKEQDDIKVFREWLKRDRETRKEDAEVIEQNLDEAIDKLNTFEDRLVEENEQLTRIGFGQNELVPNAHKSEIERYHRILQERVWSLKRQIRDLIRWERDDLEWMSKLERQEREADKHHGSAETKQQQRTANWKEKRESQRQEPKTG